MPHAYLSVVLVLSAGLCYEASCQPQPRQTENVILITMDGFRWEELFGGADSTLLNDDEFVDPDDRADLRNRFWAETAGERRRRLMPFFWDSLSARGVVLGNRRLGNRANVTNTHVFSYPGYNEILTGFADERIDSNDKVYNKNVTVLEWLNGHDELRGRVAAYTSWDVFPYIINEPRSGVPVNSGFEVVAGADITRVERTLSEVQSEVETPWSWERHDAFTHHLAVEYLRRARPRVLYIGYGDTDEYGHSGDYTAYLKAAQRTDGYVAQLWRWIQSDDEYRDRTTLVITTDHGRGAGRRFVGHGSDWVGSEAIWIAVVGPDTPDVGEATLEAQYYQNQIAATVATLLGYDYTNTQAVGAAIGDSW